MLKLQKMKMQKIIFHKKLQNWIFKSNVLSNNSFIFSRPSTEIYRVSEKSFPDYKIQLHDVLLEFSLFFDAIHKFGA